MRLEIKSLAVRISVVILALNITIKCFCKNPSEIIGNINFGILGLRPIPIEFL